MHRMMEATANPDEGLALHHIAATSSSNGGSAPASAYSRPLHHSADEDTGQRRRVIIRKNTSPLPQRGQRQHQQAASTAQQPRFDVTSRSSQQADLDLHSMVKGVSSVSSQVMPI